MRPAVAVVVFGVSTLVAVSASAQAPGETWPYQGPVVQQVPQFDPDGGVMPDQQAPPVDDAALDQQLPPDQVVDVSPDDAAAQLYDDGYDPQAAAQFQAGLAPYGSWIDDPAYGEVWEPSSSIVGADFTPYSSGGRWAMTEFGWTWVSDWDWGWAPFHYGRWTMVGQRGWCWVPGTIWGPGWVSWRAGGGFVGWAPLPPRGIPVTQPLVPRSPWRFVPAAQMGTRRPAYLPAREVRRVFPHTIVASTMPGAPGARPLAKVAPRMLPQTPIRPYAGMAVAARPWVRPGGGGHFLPTRTQTGAPVYGRPGQMGSRVAYSPAVGRTFAPAPPARTFRGPAAQFGQAPAPGFQTAPRASGPPPRSFAPPPRMAAPAPRPFSPAPRYSPPAPHYSAPSGGGHFSAPSGGGHVGGGSRPSGGGGSHRR
jgi:hypothetical protein